MDFLLKREIEKLSKDNQVVTSVNNLTGPSRQAIRTMEKIYAPLILLVNLNDMPDNYDSKIKQFGAEDINSTQQHIDWCKYFYDLTEVDEEDVQLRLFAQSLKGEVKNWFRALAPRSIPDFRRFETVFLEKWEEKKNYVPQMITLTVRIFSGNEEGH